MKFLAVFFTLFLAVAQAHVLTPAVSTYAALPVAAPFAYSAPLVRSAQYYSAYNALPAATTYQAVGPATVYRSPAVFADPVVGAPAVYSSFLKK